MQEADLSLIKDVAKQAGQIAMKYFCSENEVWEKTDGQGPVTAADLEIDVMMKNRLLTARPDYGWLSEESDENNERLSKEYCFIVDPIDGTRAFIAQKHTFAHSIAVAKGTEIIASVVYMPALRALYFASKGRGAFCNQNQIHVGSKTKLQDAVILARNAQMNAENWPKAIPPFQLDCRSSLAYRLALVAEGKFDGMLTIRPSWEWDIAGGALICQEANACITDANGLSLKFNQSPPQLAGVIAANPSLHAQIMKYR